MQIENHKEEVPFGHYQGLFEKAEAAEMAARTGVPWDGKEFYVNLLGVTYAIAHPVYGIRICHSEERSDEESPSTKGILHFVQDDRKYEGDPSQSEIAQDDRKDGALPGEAGCDGQGSPKVANCLAALPPLPLQTFLLRYLLEGKQVAWQGGWKTFREMPWGELYIKPYTGRVLTRAAFTFGTRVDAFRAACEKMGAIRLSHGDAGYQLELLGGYAMQIMVWEGDDEFPPNAQVLYSDNFEHGFAPEDRVVAGDLLITAIKGKM